MKRLQLSQQRKYKPNKAVKDGKSYCVNRDVICTIPKFGGNATERRRLQSKDSQIDNKK